jgi:cytochrome P450
MVGARRLAEGVTGMVEIADTLSMANLARPEVRADPYSLYARIRSEDPVHWDEPMGFWVITRYADLVHGLHEPCFSKAQGMTTALGRYPDDEQALATPIYRFLSKQLLYADPPYHAHLRGLMNKAFTPRVVEGMRGSIQRLVDELLDVAPASGPWDVISQFAYPLPVRVILNMLGLPPSDRERFKEWSDDFGATIGVVRRTPRTQLEKSGRSLAAFATYIDNFQASHCLGGHDDLLTALFNAEEQSSRLSREELVANAMLLLFAGHETTSNLIGNGVLALLRHPDQMQMLRDNPERLPDAIEEMMRYDSPVHVVWRLATEDIELGGQVIRKGQMVNFMLGAANRDPEQFPEPDRFDITRNAGKQVDFGLGTHFCLGSPLARLEAPIAFASLLRRLARMRLATQDLEYKEQPVFHALKALPISV